MSAENPTRLGDWESVKILGSGGFGIVTLWKHSKHNEKVAIKKCRWGRDTMMTAKHIKCWAQEVEIMQRLSHPNVVKARSFPPELQSLTSDLPLLCMEYCSGGDLRQILNKPENCCGLKEMEVRCLLSDIKAAIQYLHSHRIIHRDLKPENIVLQEEPHHPMIYKLIDLGYAKELDSSSHCSSFVGTMQYLAPEFFTSTGYTASVDYWSLGLVSHEAITGVRPFLPNAVSPAEWIPKVQEKSTNDICIYEVPITKEVKFSQQLSVENFISRCFREELEKWLRLALEWDPKKRGRFQTDNSLAIFSALDEILAKKIVTVFCVTVFASYSYHVDSATAVTTLQLWIERDTRQPVNEQLLLLPSGKQLTHDMLAVDCWSPNEITMLYVFSRTSFALPNVKVPDRVPALVHWVMENPKEHLEYHHQKHIWRHAVFFLRQEHELFQLFLEAYAVKMLSLIDQSYQLTELELSVAVEVEHLVAMQKMSCESLRFDQKCYVHLADIPNLGELRKLMTGWTKEVNGFAQKVVSCQEAMAAMKVRTQEAHSRLAALQEYRDPGQQDLLAFENWMKEGYNCYNNIRKRKDRTTKHQSLDMVRILYNCLKQIDISLLNKEFATHLKLLMSCELEIFTLQKALSSFKQQVVQSKHDLMRCQYQRQKDTWALVKKLATQKDQDSRPQSSLSLHMPPSITPPPGTPTSLLNFTVPPPARDPSPIQQYHPQVPPHFMLSQSPTRPSEKAGTNLAPAVNMGQPKATSTEISARVHHPSSSLSETTCSSAKVDSRPKTQTNLPSQETSENKTLAQPNLSSAMTTKFDTSPNQTPMSRTPLVQNTPASSFLLAPKSSYLESENLIYENINIRYAMQDSMVSFTQCSNMLNNDFDWTFLDTHKK